jgi:hypothetical protein
VLSNGDLHRNKTTEESSYCQKSLRQLKERTPANPTPAANYHLSHGHPRANQEATLSVKARRHPLLERFSISLDHIRKS